MITVEPVAPHHPHHPPTYQFAQQMFQRVKSAVSILFSHGGTYLRKPEDAGNSAHDHGCFAEMIACAEDTGENGCHECFTNVRTTDYAIDTTMASAACSELTDLLCYAFTGREACTKNAALVAYAGE